MLPLTLLVMFSISLNTFISFSAFLMAVLQVFTSCPTVLAASVFWIFTNIYLSQSFWLWKRASSLMVPEPVNKVGEECRMFFWACLSIARHSAAAFTLFLNHALRKRTSDYLGSCKNKQGCVFESKGLFWRDIMKIRLSL